MKRTPTPKQEHDVAYVDTVNPGIVRFYEDAGDGFSGILAGTRAQRIVDALNEQAARNLRGKK